MKLQPMCTPGAIKCAQQLHTKVRLTAKQCLGKRQLNRPLHVHMACGWTQQCCKSLAHAVATAVTTTTRIHAHTCAFCTQQTQSTVVKHGHRKKPSIQSAGYSIFWTSSVQSNDRTGHTVLHEKGSTQNICWHAAVTYRVFVLSSTVLTTTEQRHAQLSLAL